MRCRSRDRKGCSSRTVRYRARVERAGRRWSHRGSNRLQDRFTIPLKPFIGMTVIVEVAEAPAETVAGERVEAAIVKSATRVAVTVKLTVVLWFTDPAPAITVTV